MSKAEVSVEKTTNALKFASMASTMSWITWVPRLPDIKDHLNLSLETLGTILMIAGLTMSIASKPTAYLIQHFTSKRTILMGIAISISGNALIGYAPNGVILTIGLMVASFGVGLVNTGNQTQINNVSVLSGHNKRHSLAAFAPIGSLLSMILGITFLNILETPQYLLMIQIITGSVLLLVNPRMRHSDQGTPDKGEAKVKMPWFGKRIGIFWMALAALYATTLAEFSVADWSGILARDEFKIGEPWFLLVAVSFQLGLMSSRFLADRFNAKFGVARNVVVGTLTGSAIWGIVIFLAADIGKTNSELALAVACFGFYCAGWGIGPNWGVLLAAATVPGFPPPVALARVFGLLGLVFSFGPGVVGWLAESVGLTNAMFLPVICLALVGVLVPKIVAVDHAARAELGGGN